MSNKINIAYVCSTLEQTGPTSQLYNIISGLNKNIYHPIIITLSPEPHNSLKEKFKYIEIIRLSFNNKFAFFSGRKSFLKVLNEKNIDLVHSQGIRPDLLCMMSVPKDKWISTLRNIPFHDYIQRYGKLRGIPMSVIHLLCLRYAKNVAVVSLEQEYKLKNYLNNIVFIPNGVDTIFYSHKNISTNITDKLKKELSKKENDIYLIYTGILSPRKNIEFLLDLSLNLDNNIKLLIVGTGELLGKIEKHAAIIKNKAILIGQTNDVRPYLAISDIFILASKSEGLPNSALEAYSMGLPLLLSDIPPHEYISNLIPKNTMLINIQNKKIFEEINGYIYGLLKNKDNENMKKDTVKYFSSQVNSQKYQNLYKNLI